MDKKELTYDEAMAEIEAILAKFRNEEMSVDALAAEVRRATTLIAFCRKRLLKAESDVKRSPENEAAGSVGRSIMCRGPSCNALQGGRCRSRAFSTWGAAANAPCAVRAAVGSCPTATSRRVPMRSVRRACRWSGTGCCGSTSRAKPICCAGRSGSCISPPKSA